MSSKSGELLLTQEECFQVSRSLSIRQLMQSLHGSCLILAWWQSAATVWNTVIFHCWSSIWLV